MFLYPASVQSSPSSIRASDRSKSISHYTSHSGQQAIPVNGEYSLMVTRQPGLQHVDNMNHGVLHPTEQDYLHTTIDTDYYSEISSRTSVNADGRSSPYQSLGRRPVDEHGVQLQPVSADYTEIIKQWMITYPDYKHRYSTMQHNDVSAAFTTLLRWCSTSKPSRSMGAI